MTIERSTTARGDYGEEVEGWATLKIVWAGIEPLSGGESIRAGAIDSSVTHMITLRFTDITSADRITFGARVFNLVRVLNHHNRGIKLQIEAKEDV
ncbi:MAG: phage head closure protein [Ketobacter sp.]|nr:phage head closure protein [Ketobacter sp.]